MKRENKPKPLPKDVIRCKAEFENIGSPSHGLMQKVADALLKIEFVKRFYKPTKTILLSSGGNDSTLLLHLAGDSADAVGHCNTGTGIEDANIFMKDTVSQYGKILIEEHCLEIDSYRRLVLKYGFPGPAKHFMAYSSLKQRSLRRIRNRFVQNNRVDRVLFLAGIRADESVKRMGYDTWLNRDGSMIWLSPIYLFTRDDMDEYRRLHPRLQENPVSAKLHISGECLCGAFSRHGEIDEISFWYPKKANELHDLEREVKATGSPYCVWGGPRKNLPTTILSPGALCAGCQFLDQKVANEI